MDRTSHYDIVDSFLYQLQISSIWEGTKRTKNVVIPAFGGGVSIFAQFVYNVWDINFKTPLKKWKANTAFAIAFIIGLIIRLKMIMIYVLTFYLTFLYYSS